MTEYVTLDYESYEQARQSFTWEVPDTFNMAYDLVRKHENPDEKIALDHISQDRTRQSYTFEEVDRWSNRVANGLTALGVGRGDRVAVADSQRPATLLTHLAAWKIGAISVPLSILFGPTAMEHRIRDSGAKVVVTASSATDTVVEVAGNCPTLEHVIPTTTNGDTGTTSLDELCEGESGDFEIAKTRPETPAVIFYTSGSTGQPKGVLHRHELWIGHLPAINMYFEGGVRGDAVYWAAADWAWIGSLGTVVFPAWHYGRPVVGHPKAKFDPHTALELMDEFDITNAFIPPTAFRMMMNLSQDEIERYDIDLNGVCSGGEPLTPEILAWADATGLGPVNELYGQTESNVIVCNSRRWFDAKPGSMGKPAPGHEVAVIDATTGERKAPSELGELAIKRTNDPVVFSEYWNADEKTDRATLGDWHLTGDLAVVDDEGYLWYESRKDELIITSGYRVSPYEVERTLLEHGLVEQVGVTGIPDQERGEIIKAFVELTAGTTESAALKEELQGFVRENLAEYEYPRAVEFVESLPRTTTGKIKRSTLREWG